MKRSGIQRHTPMPRPTKPIERAPIRRRKRSVSEQAAKFDREYGGEERQVFVASLPCIVLGCPRPSENAHVVKDDEHGTGRKSGYRTIAPCCHLHHQEGPNSLHQLGPRSFERLHGLSLEACARHTEALWQRHQERTGLTPLSAIVPGVVRAIEDGEAC